MMAKRIIDASGPKIQNDDSIDIITNFGELRRHLFMIMDILRPGLVHNIIMWNNTKTLYSKFKYLNIIYYIYIQYMPMPIDYKAGSYFKLHNTQLVVPLDTIIISLYAEVNQSSNVKKTCEIFTSYVTVPQVTPNYTLNVRSDDINKGGAAPSAYGSSFKLYNIEVAQRCIFDVMVRFLYKISDLIWDILNLEITINHTVDHFSATQLKPLIYCNNLYKHNKVSIINIDVNGIYQDKNNLLIFNMHGYQISEYNKLLIQQRVLCSLDLALRLQLCFKTQDNTIANPCSILTSTDLNIIHGIFICGPITLPQLINTKKKNVWTLI